MGTETEEKTEVEVDEMQDAVESIDDLTDDDPTGDVDLSEFGITEDDDVTDTTPKDKTKPDTKPEWDKERQFRDQANAAEAKMRQAQQAAQQAEARAEQASKDLKEMQKKLDELAEVEDVNLDDIDEDVNDPKVIAAIKAMKKQIKRTMEKAERLEKDKEEIVSQIVRSQKESDKEKANQEIIDSVEGKLAKRFGIKNPASLRNEAIRMANKICIDRGYSPKDRYESAEMLEECYFKLAKNSKPAKDSTKPSVPTDTGKGSSSAVVKAETDKPCSLNQAVKDLRKKLKV